MGCDGLLVRRKILRLYWLARCGLRVRNVGWNLCRRKSRDARFCVSQGGNALLIGVLLIVCVCDGLLVRRKILHCCPNNFVK